MRHKLQLRRDTAANWEAANPTLAQGEVGLILDSNGKVIGQKIGDGVTEWKKLGYKEENGVYFRGMIQLDSSILDQPYLSLPITPFNEGDIIKVNSSMVGNFNLTIRKFKATSNGWTNQGDENVLLNADAKEYQFNSGTIATVYWRKLDRTAFSEDEFNSFEVLIYRKQGKNEYKPEIRFAVKTNTSPCNSNATTTDDIQTSSNIPKALDGILRLPDTYTYHGKKTPLVMCCHGASGYISDTDWYPGNADDCVEWINSLLNNGYAVFDMNNLRGGTLGTNDFGCPQLIEGYKNAIDWIKEHYNVSEKIIIWSMSLGTYIGTNFINSYPDLVSCYLMAGPRTSVKAFLETLTSDNQLSIKKYLARIFGFNDLSGEAYEEDKMRPYDLYEQIVNIDSKGFLFKNFPPTKILAGGDDASGGKWAVGYEDVYDSLLNGGSNVTMRVVEGYNHSNICHIYGSELCAECLLFFEKYRV